MVNKNNGPKNGVTIVKVDPEEITDNELDELLDSVLGPEDDEEDEDGKKDKE